MLYTVIALGGFCVYLMVSIHIERHKATKREQELLNRLMSRNFVNYATGEAIIKEAETGVDSTAGGPQDVYPVY